MFWFTMSTLTNWREVCPIQMHDEIGDVITKLGLKVSFVKPRKTKFGDFRVRLNEPMEITVNNNLGVTHGALTFFHELAHAICYTQHGNKVKPHGKHWKAIYGGLILHVLDCQFFPPHLEKVITQHAIATKSSTCYDTKLMLAINNGLSQNTNKVAIASLFAGDTFEFGNHRYELGQKRRTRFLCYRLPDKKPFTFSAAALVEMME